jgi:hypothetical protein
MTVPIERLCDGYNRRDDDDDRTRHLDAAGIDERNVTATREAVLSAARELATGDGDTLSRESTEKFETFEQLVGDLARIEKQYARIRQASKNPNAIQRADTTFTPGGDGPT